MINLYKQEKKTLFNVRLDIWICLFLVISILCVYWQVRTFSFLNYDDRDYVTENYYVKDGLTLKSIAWSTTAVKSNNWHPLTWISHMLDYQIYGMEPGRHHLTNVIFHVLNSVLLFFIFSRMTGALFKSAFVAALFALHPLHVESVAWIAERKDVLSTFFLMLTLWSYTRYVEHSGFDKYLLLILFYILGLMAKPMLVTLPFVLLLLDYWPFKRFQLMMPDSENQAIHKPFYFGLIWEKLPLFLLSTASCVVTYLVQNSSGAVSSLAAIPFHDRIANVLSSYVSYIQKMFWPHDLAVLYPYPESISLWRIVGSGLLLLMVSVAVFRMIRLKPYHAVGWLWYLGMLVPVIGIVQVGSQAMADRYTYVPLIGIFIMITWGISDWVSNWRYKKIGLFTASASVLSILMVTSWLQVKYWSNSAVLFKHTIDVTGDNSTAQLNLGEALAEENKVDSAVKHYYEALRIKPDRVAPHLNLGVTFREQGKLDLAMDHFLSALKLEPDCAITHYELGDTLEKKGDLSGAAKHYLEALRISPGYAAVYNKLGVMLAGQKKVEAAIVSFSKALQINPGYSGAHYNLAKIYSNRNDTEKAIFHYKKALQFNPDMAQALYHLSWILAGCEDEKFRNGQEAVLLAEKLYQITQYGEPLAMDALAAAYAENGRYEEAASIAQKAIKQASKLGSKELVQGLGKRLKLYQNKTPYRQKTDRERSR